MQVPLGVTTRLYKRLDRCCPLSGLRQILPTGEIPTATNRFESFSSLLFMDALGTQVHMIHVL